MPEKWAHLKVNASKCTTMCTRTKKAFQVITSKKAAAKRRSLKMKGCVQEWAEDKLQEIVPESYRENVDNENNNDNNEEDDEDDNGNKEEGSPKPECAN